MSRARRQQRKRARRWVLEVRDTVYGWRASWWLRGRERFGVHCYSRVERRESRLVFGEELFTHAYRATYYTKRHGLPLVRLSTF